MGRVLVSLLALSLAGHAGFAQPRQSSKDPKIQPRPSARPPSPIDFEKAWHLLDVRLPDVWKIQRGSPETVIAVVDSGIHYNHHDLSPNLVRRPPFFDPAPTPSGFKTDILGWDFVQKDHRPWDRTGHGTYVAGLAAGILGSRDGGAGVCPECSLLTARFMNAEGTGWDEHCLQAMEYVIQRRAAVMNLSFGGEGYDRDYERVLEGAMENDIVVVVAAGNDGDNNDYGSMYPANFDFPNLIAVAATDRTGALWKDSNYGKKKVHIAAPGVELWGPWNDGTYYAGTGTSFSAPVVSGAVGLIRSHFPKMTAPEVVELLMRSARPSPVLKDKVRSGGSLDVVRAFQLAMSPAWKKDEPRRRAFYEKIKTDIRGLSRSRDLRGRQRSPRRSPRFQFPPGKGEDFRTR